MTSVPERLGTFRLFGNIPESTIPNVPELSRTYQLHSNVCKILYKLCPFLFSYVHNDPIKYLSNHDSTPPRSTILNRLKLCLVPKNQRCLTIIAKQWSTIWSRMVRKWDIFECRFGFRESDNPI